VILVVAVVMMELYFNAFSLMLKTHLPTLATHMENNGVAPTLYLVDWMLTLFTKSVPIDIAVHILDIFVVEGDYFLFRAGLGLLSALSPQLITADFDTIMRIMQSLTPRDLDKDEVLDKTKAIPLTQKSYQALLRKANDSNNTQEQ